MDGIYTSFTWNVLILWYYYTSIILLSRIKRKACARFEFQIWIIWICVLLTSLPSLFPRLRRSRSRRRLLWASLSELRHFRKFSTSARWRFSSAWYSSSDKCFLVDRRSRMKVLSLSRISWMPKINRAARSYQFSILILRESDKDGRTLGYKIYMTYYTLHTSG